MAKILKFRPPEGTLRRMLIQSLEQDGAKQTGEQARADKKPAEILPLFRPRRRNRI